MYYIEKDIEVESGVIANCWVVCDKNEKLYEQQNLEENEEVINPSDYVQMGRVTIVGYKDVKSWLAGKLTASRYTKTVSYGDLARFEETLLKDLSEYVNLYDATQAMVIQAILATPEFEGGKLKNTDDV